MEHGDIVIKTHTAQELAALCYVSRPTLSGSGSECESGSERKGECEGKQRDCIFALALHTHTDFVSRLKKQNTTL
jgi:hypothetical protein